MTRRSHLALMVLGASLLVACQPGTDRPAGEAVASSASERSPERDGLFVHISHGPAEPHRVLMGLRMADLMAEDHDVLVYFDIDGVQVVLKDAEDLTHGEFPSSRAQIGKLLDKEITLLVCPGCLKAAGKTPEDVVDGVRIAEKEPFFGFTDGRILAIDY